MHWDSGGDVGDKLVRNRPTIFRHFYKLVNIGDILDVDVRDIEMYVARWT